ncbi:MAG: aconitate hydratase [Deltaproteobacteria bacterium]|nr:aconitate hydratase [Deltaproteobacteria bacterium]
MAAVETTPELVEKALQKIEKSYPILKKRLGRELTLSEKLVLGHLDDPETQTLARGEATLRIRPDRVGMQDATAQMAILQFMQAGIDRVRVPSTVHCDHLIQAHTGSAADTQTAATVNKEVYDFLESASKKYGIGFWGPGAGIIHQVLLEKYAFPGGLMIGTDSHTPNGGGIGMIAIGVGGADAAEAMAGLVWEVLHPKVIGVKLTGKLNGWAAPKDVILKVCEILTVKGGTNAIVEYFGEGASTISCTGKGTICNMGAEHGATTSVFPFDESMVKYLKATEREKIAEICKKYSHLLQNDPDVNVHPEKYYDRVIEINLSTLEPHICGPHTPDLARPISKMKSDVKANQYPDNLTAALIGSCTNSSYEDIERTVDVAKQALAAGIKAPIKLMVTPGSEQVFETIKRDGYMEILEKAGATVLANACGPCIGQWKRDDIKKGEKNSILNSYNRNFPGRNDGNAETLSFIASPEIVMALGLTGKLSFDPLNDEIEQNGKKLKLKAPKPAADVPPKGFAISWAGYVAPESDASKIDVKISPTSERLAFLPPFAAWDKNDFIDLPILLKASGKCTTDHISPAGPWLKFRGHLDKISDNMFSGAINAFTKEAGKGMNVLTGDKSISFQLVARDYKAKNSRWVVIGDENYGEGSSREHAAMEPRYLGAAAVIAKSFARIHETNLKKQGLLPLHFVNVKDYDLIGETDRISILGLKDLAPKKNLKAQIKKPDGKTTEIEVRHTMTAEQIKWFQAGSALNAAKLAAA